MAESDKKELFITSLNLSAGVHNINEIFAILDKTEPQDLDCALNSLVAKSYGADEAILNYLKMKSNDHTINWSAILEFAFDRRYPYSEIHKIIPNFPVVYYILENHYDTIPIATYHTMIEYFIEHIYGKCLSNFPKYKDCKESANKIYVNKLQFCSLDGLYDKEVLFEKSDEVIRDSYEDILGNITELISRCYNNDLAILSYIEQFLDDSNYLSHIFEAAFERPVLEGRQFDSLPNVHIIKYILDEYNTQIKPKTYKYIIDIILSHLTGLKHKDGVRIDK